MKAALIAAVRFEDASQRAIPVIGLFYLASYTEKYVPGVTVKVFRKPEEILEYKPDIVGISTVTENMNIALQWAEEFRNSLNVPVIIGGDHISALPHTLPPVFDLGVVGEGEETFAQICRLISEEKNWRQKLSDIDGICYHGKDGVALTPPRPLIEPMEKIPFPRREKEFWGGFHYCFTSRGCPYHCTFCSPSVIWKKFRPFSAEYVMEEFREIFRNFKPYYIHLFDDLFIGDKARVKAVKKMVRREGFHRLVSFGGHIRAELMDDELCEDLMGMNFNSGSFGAESGSDKILKFLKCGSSSVEVNQRAIDVCYKWNLMLNLSFIIGTPGETEEDIIKTIKFIEKNKRKFVGIEVFALLPYPGTPLWRMMKRKGVVSDNMNWDYFRTKAFFSDYNLDDDFLYINEDMDRKTFIKYAKIFQEIDRDLNEKNMDIYTTIEKGVISNNEKSTAGK